MKNNLLVGLLGHRHSGKSTTWYDLFKEQVRTGSRIRRLYLTRNQYVEVFLVSGSPEERAMYVGDIVGELRPRIILCSMQYVSEVNETINFFTSNDYFLYIQWLNPGFNDQNNVAHADYLGIINRLLLLDSTISIRNGKHNRNQRVQEIADHIFGWASHRNLLITDVAL